MLILDPFAKAAEEMIAPREQIHDHNDFEAARVHDLRGTAAQESDMLHALASDKTDVS